MIGMKKTKTVKGLFRWDKIVKTRKEWTWYALIFTFKHETGIEIKVGKRNQL